MSAQDLPRMDAASAGSATIAGVAARRGIARLGDDPVSGFDAGLL
jgi:hypothetical protein